ncbi:MAG TPA: TadE/TadG family type IV pilus assembly protein [Acidobacteriota bacterium]|nr:TadE/TadG family type IV pilus assembly protein [Acidobacteriota bacterium]
MRRNKERGVAIVEMAMILPLFLLLILGMIEFSLILYNKAMVTNASREGARAGIVFRHPDPVSDTEIGTVVNNYLASRLISFNGSNTATTTVTRAGGSPGGSLTVKVDYTYGFLVLPNFMGGGNSIPMSAITVMRME